MFFNLITSEFKMKKWNDKKSFGDQIYALLKTRFSEMVGARTTLKTMLMITFHIDGCLMIFLVYHEKNNGFYIFKNFFQTIYKNVDVFNFTSVNYEKLKLIYLQIN